MIRASLKWLLRGFLVVLVSLVIVGIGAAIALNTEAGTRWVFERIGKQMDAEISFSAMEGTLWQGLRIPSVEFRDATQVLHADDAELKINWSYVTRKTLVFDVLTFATVTYRSLLPPEPAPFEPGLAPIPVHLVIRHGSIGKLVTHGEASDLEIFEINIENLDAVNRQVAIDGISAYSADIDFVIRQMNVELDGQVPLSFELGWSRHAGDLAGQGSVQGSLAEIGFEQFVTGSYPATVNGTVHMLHQIEPSFEMDIRWHRWTLDDLALDDGMVGVSGTMDDYSVEYQMSLQAPLEQRANISGTASGDSDKLREFAATIKLPAASAEAQGSLAWAPGFSADVQLQVQEFDPSILHPALTGKLAAEAGITASGAGPARLTIDSLNGVLNGEPVLGGGEVLVEAGKLFCDPCTLVAGDNRIDAKGTVDADSIALDLDIDARSLDTLWPELDGHLSVAGMLSGSLPDPLFAGTLMGQDLAYAGLMLREVQVDSTATGLDALNLSLHASQLSFDGSELGDLAIHVAGKSARYQLDVDWKAPMFELTAELGLARDQAGFEGRIEAAELREEISGKWVMNGRPEFTYDLDSLHVGAHRWSNPGGELRVERIVSTGREHRLVANLSDVSLQTADLFLPPDYRLHGTASASIDIALQAGTWDGEINWRHTGTRLGVLQENGEFREIGIPGVRLDSRFIDGGVDVSAEISVDPGIKASLELELDRQARDSQMRADLRLNGADWEWVSALVPQIDKFAGLIAVQASASGPLFSPEIRGGLTWRNGSLAVPALNVALEHIELDVTGGAQGSALISGSANAGEGQLTVAGSLANAMNEARRLDIRLSGENAHLLNWPEYKVWASPEIAITGTSSGWMVTGDLAVPKADIRVVDLQDEAVVPSPDIRIVGIETAPPVPTSYSGEVLIKLGDEVHLDLLGLETRLTGDLLVKMPRNRPLSAEGQVNLEGGVFSAYGQKLLISQGTLTFTGPLDDPLVDVKAVRVIESFEGPVTAGIHLQGRAQNLASSIFSEPAMAEADALSYLLLGRPLGMATGAEGNQLSGAAIALGLGRAANITEQIGQRLGLDQLTIAGDGGEATALVAGKQINSRLYARYAYGAFSRIGALLLRYQLTERLMLEAGASETQSINVLYTVKKK